MAGVGFQFPQIASLSWSKRLLDSGRNNVVRPKFRAVIRRLPWQLVLVMVRNNSECQFSIKARLINRQLSPGWIIGHGQVPPGGGGAKTHSNEKAQKSCLVSCIMFRGRIENADCHCQGIKLHWALFPLLLILSLQSPENAI